MDGCPRKAIHWLTVNIVFFINVSNMGETAIKSHMKGKKHIQKSPPAQSSKSSDSFSAFRVPNPEKPKPSQSSESPSSSKTVQKSLDILVAKDNFLSAEIRWVLKCVQSRYSQRSCHDIQELLNIMFPGHILIEKFTIGRTKCAYILNHGLAPYFADLLPEEVKRSPKYRLSFDESLNKKMQKGQMDILVRFWDCEKHMAQTRYHNSEFLGGAKAEQILENFIEGSKKLDLLKMLQVSSDGPNVNLKFLELYGEKREMDEVPRLVDIGTCGLHTVHGSLKNRIKSSGWEIGKILKAVFKLLDESPARRDIFRNVTESEVFPLPYCGHRWCENECCLNCAGAIWQCFVKFIEYLISLSSSSSPKEKVFPSFKRPLKIL